MKRILAMLLAAMLVLSLAACGGNSGGTTDGSGDTSGDIGTSGSDSGEKIELNVIISQLATIPRIGGPPLSRILRRPMTTST